MYERNYKHRWAPTALSLAISEIAFGVAYVLHIPSLQGSLRDVCRRFSVFTSSFTVSLFRSVRLLSNIASLSDDPPTFPPLSPTLLLSDHRHFQSKLAIARYSATKRFSGKSVLNYRTYEQSCPNPLMASG